MKKIILLLIAILTMTSAFGSLQLQSVYTDPAIISAGDEVELVVQYQASHQTTSDTRIGDSNYRFETALIPKSSVAQEYITILDREGQNVAGAVFGSEVYNQKFLFRVEPNAPVGTYLFELQGRWIVNDEPQSTTIAVDVPVQVRRQGIIVDVAGVRTDPARITPGTSFITLQGLLQNSGVRDVKGATIQIHLPDGLTASYADNNQVFVGDVSQNAQTEFTAFFDVDASANSGLYDIVYEINFRDEFGVEFTQNQTSEIQIRSRPYIEVLNVTGELIQSKTGEVRILLTNTGESLAENIDVRLLKNNAQPFEIPVRSDYVGNIGPNQTAEAVFDVKTLRGANIKDHNFQLIIRAKGDSELNDDSIYTFTRDITVPVKENSFPVLIVVGIGLILFAVLLLIWRRKK